MRVKQGDELFIPYMAKDVRITPSAVGMALILCNPAQVEYDLPGAATGAVTA